MNSTIDGLNLAPPFFESERTQIYRGCRDDGVNVIVKALHPGAMSARNVANLRHEHRMLGAIASEYVPRVLGFEYAPDRHAAIVMEDIGARGSLEEMSLDGFDLATVLDMAQAVTSALVAVHREGMIHYDIKPSNIIRAPDGRVQLIDFGLAMRLENEDPELSGHEDLVGTLPYVSPEQTGRMNCRVDHRGDLYSLGIVLYRLIAGVLPFAASDALGWVHAHIATPAVPLHVRRPGVPRVLSDVVARLMEKDREQRYQSAAGVLADLRRCADEMRETGTITHFEIGASDLSDRFHIPDRLYGREHEIETLHAAFERVGSGSRPELLLVTGAPGIGKSSLVRELNKPLALRRGAMISGKFDLLQRETPLTGVVAAFEELVHQLLKKSDADLAARRADILEAVGSNGQVLVDLVPSLELVIGPQPAVPELGGIQRLNRLELVVERFVRALARPEHPLVLFMDDLQWVDPASLMIFEHILRSRDMQCVMMIGAYRSNEVDAAHPLAKAMVRLEEAGLRIHRLELGPLTGAQVEALVADSLRRDPRGVAQLAHIAHERTDGNPFFIRQFLNALHQEGLIRFDHDGGSWDWDAEQIVARGITDDVSELLVHRFEALPEDTRYLVQLAGCMGNRFDLRTLATVAERGFVETFVCLWPALGHRLVLAEGSVLARLRDREADPEDALEPREAAVMVFRFAHDRVQQAAAASIEDVRGRAEIHLEIGRTLTRHLSPVQCAERSFEICDQLNAGRQAMTESAQRLELAALDLRCGRRALVAAAYDSAVGYLNVAAELLDEEPVSAERRDLWFAVHLERARACYLSGRHADAARAFPALIERALSDDERLEVYAAQSEQAAMTGAYDEGLIVARRALAIHGLQPPGDDQEAAAELLAQEFAAVERNLDGREIASLVHAPPLESGAILRQLEDLERMNALSYLAGEWTLNAWGIARATNLSLVHGNAYTSGPSYASFGFLMAVQGRYDLARAFGQLGLALADRSVDPRSHGRTYIAYYPLLAYYFTPLRELAESLYRGYPICLEGGDLHFASYELLLADYFRLASGDPLIEVRDEMVRHIPFFERSAPQTLQLFYRPHLVYTVCTLRGEPMTEFGPDFDAEAFLQAVQNVGLAQSWYYSAALEVEVLTGVVRDLDTVAERIAAIESGTSGTYIVHQSRFYAALHLLALLRRSGDEALDPEARERAEDLIERWQDETWRAGQECAANFLHMYRLVEAERARNRGDLRAAMNAYEDATRVAREQCYLDKHALARQLYGEFWLEMDAPSNAEAHLRKAVELYREWGAEAVVRAVQERHPDLDLSWSSGPISQDGSTHPRASSTSIFGAELDLDSVVKACNSIAREILLPRLASTLMSVLMENAGAQRGAILVPDADGLCVVAEGDMEHPSQFHEIGAMPLDSWTAGPRSIVKYVYRSGRTVVLADGRADPEYAHEPYVQANDVRSLLCMPVFKQGDLAAIVHLENRLAANTFTSGRRQLLHLLSGQIAISLENARLYSQLEQLLQEMGSAERLKHTFLATVSHELRTPLNAIINMPAILHQSLPAELAQEPEIREQLQLIEDSGHELLRAINQIIDFSRLEGGIMHVEPESLSLAAVVAEVVESFRPLARDKGISLRPDLDERDTVVMGDRRMLAKIASHLLSNAIKFSPAGTHVDICVTGAAEPGDEVVLRVSDQGVGIDPQARALIFDGFRQASEGSRRSHGGTGLGLAVTKRMVRLHGGRILLHSEPGTGSIFEVHLPR